MFHYKQTFDILTFEGKVGKKAIENAKYGLEKMYRTTLNNAPFLFTSHFYRDEMDSLGLQDRLAHQEQRSGTLNFCSSDMSVGQS